MHSIKERSVSGIRWITQLHPPAACRDKTPTADAESQAGSQLEGWRIDVSFQPKRKRKLAQNPPGALPPPPKEEPSHQAGTMTPPRQ